jgi:hypothetical protein
MRRTVIPLVIALFVFVLLMPLTCTGSSDDPRQFCETVYRWQLPWSTIDGPVGTTAMYGLPLVAAIAGFLLARSAIGRRGTE